MNDQNQKNNEENDNNFRQNYSTLWRINEGGNSYRLKDIQNLPFNGQKSLNTPRSMLGRRTRTQKPETKCEPHNNQGETSIITSHTLSSQDEEGYWSVFGKNINANDETGNTEEMAVPLKQASSKIPTRTFELVLNRKFSPTGRVEIRSGEPFSITAEPQRISSQDRLAKLKASFRTEENEMSWITRKFKKEMSTSNLVGSKKDETNRFSAAFSNKQYDMMLVHELPAHSNLILNNDGDVYVNNSQAEGNSHRNEENNKTPSRHFVGHSDVKHYFQNESSMKQRNFEEDEPKATDEKCREANTKFNSSDSDVSNYSSCVQEEVEMRQNFLITIFELINELSVEKVRIDEKWKILREEQKNWNEKWNQLSGSLRNYHSTILNVKNNI